MASFLRKAEETRPLLTVNKEPEGMCLDELDLKMPKWLAILFAIFITALQMCAIILNSYIMNQYSYHAYMQERFPNASHTSTAGQSECERNTSSPHYKQQIEVQKLTSALYVYYNLANYNIIGILFTLNLSTYSDVYGRRLFFIAPVLGTLVKSVLLAATIYFNFKIEWTILFYVIEGSMGSWVSTLSLVYSVIADLTVPGKPRTFAIGCFEAIGGMSSFIITLLSGYLIKWTNGFFYPTVLSVAMALVALIIVTCLLPETLHESRKRSKVSLIRNMGRVFDVYRPNFSPHGKQWMYVTLLFTFMLSNLSGLAKPQIETLYQLSSPFCWNSVKIGWYGAMRLGILSAANLVQIKIFHMCGLSDEYLILASMVTTVVSCVIEGLATNDFMLYAALWTGIGSSLGMAISRAVMSRITPPDKQGSVFAGIAVPEIVFSLASGLGANAVYSATVSIYRGFTFFIMGGYGLIGVVLSIVLIVGQNKSKITSVPAGTTITVRPPSNDFSSESDVSSHQQEINT